MLAAVTAFVTRDQPTGMPDLDVQRMDASFHPSARLGWHSVEVGLDRHAALLVDQREHDLRQVEALGRTWQQVATLDRHRPTDRLAAAIQHPRFVRAGGRQHFSASRSVTTGTGTRWLRRK
jgi:hypothetical protein